jgi:hypothetical protein
MRKLVKGIAVALIVLGFFFMMFAVGSTESGEMECNELMVRSALGIGAMLGGGYIIYSLEEQEDAE